MAATGHSIGKDGSARLVCGAGTLTLTEHGNSCDIDFNADDHEATAYGDVNHTFLTGLTNATISYSGWWAGSAPAASIDNSVATCLHGLMGTTGCTPVFWFAPAGSTSGSLCYAACVNLQSLQTSFPADSITTMSLNFTMRSGSLSACENSDWS
jgi:hypothetical protein